MGVGLRVGGERVGMGRGRKGVIGEGKGMGW